MFKLLLIDLSLMAKCVFLINFIMDGEIVNQNFPIAGTYLTLMYNFHHMLM